MTSRSTTLGSDQEFPIAVAAQNRRRNETADPPAERGQKCTNVIADCGVNSRVTDDALFAGAALRLELRFDECDKRGARFEKFADCRQHKLQRDKADIHRGQIWRRRQPGGIEHADIGLLDGNNIGAATKARVKLIAADIDGIDLPRATLGQNFGKTAGRGADVEANASMDVHCKMIERECKLDAAARYVWMFGLRHDIGGRRNLLRCLAHRYAIGNHQARGNGGLCPGAALKQATRDQEAIGTVSNGHARDYKRDARLWAGHLTSSIPFQFRVRGAAIRTAALRAA